MKDHAKYGKLLKYWKKGVTEEERGVFRIGKTSEKEVRNIHL